MTDNSITSVEAPAAGVYRIDPEHSTVHFQGRHWFGLGSVRATFAVAAGEITVADPVEQSSVEVRIDSASFRSDQPRRDKHVASPALLDVASYPDIIFASNSVRRAADGWVVEGGQPQREHPAERLDRVWPDTGPDRNRLVAATDSRPQPSRRLATISRRP